MSESARRKHVGIVAVTAEGAALCYRTICTEGEQYFGRYGHPETTLHGYPLASYVAPMEAGRWDEVGRRMLASGRILAAAGADFLICPANTLHQALDLVRHESPLPWLHIAEEVALEASRLGVRRLGILGTRPLMEGPVYPTRLAPLGIEAVPPDPDDRRRIDELIMTDLIAGRFGPAARAFVEVVMARMSRDGCDAVAMACTEIPLLIGEAATPIPALDSTRILARAALREAAGAGTPRAPLG